MNDEFDNKSQNRYEGNGWSKYQLLVLQQLDDHNKVLQNLNKEIVDLKQMNAVSEAELKMWRTQTMATLTEMSASVDFILYDEKGLNAKLTKLEQISAVNEQARLKIKAIWAFYGAIAVVLIDVITKIVPLFLK